MVLEAQDNPFTSILMVEAADPEALSGDADPAAGQRRLVIGTDHILYLLSDSGVKTAVGGGGIANPLATDSLWDAAGDLVQGTGANTAAKLSAGTAGKVLTSNGAAAALTWETPTSSGVYPVPTPVQHPVGVFAAATTVVVTMTAPTSGNRLLAFITAASRGANSITQTNVTWTQIFTGNGNSLYTEIWAGAVSASAGTTATANFTGSNNQFMEILELSSAYPAFSTAGTPVTGTAASGTVYNVGNLVTAAGDYVAWLIAAGQANSYTVVSQPYFPMTPFGGFFRAGLLRSSGGEIALTSVNVSSNAWRGTLVKIS